ncbi:protein FAR1-related sequence 5, partial [Tanacetum coccineum]
FMDSIHSSEQSSVSQNSFSCDVVNESSVPSGSSINALTEEIIAYEKDKLDALRTAESFVTHSNFDTPGGTIYYIPKVSVDVLLVKGTLYDSVDDCIVAYIKKGCPKRIHVDTLDLENNEKQKRNSNLHITRCKPRAMFNLVPSSKNLLLNVFDTIHNHELEREEFKHLSKRDRQLTYAEQVFIVKAASVNIGATRSHHLLTGIKGSYLLVHDTTADEVSKYNYWEFCDFVSLDATFKTNKHKMVFVLFTAIDNHTFGKAPSIVATDQDGAKRNDIEAEFAGKDKAEKDDTVDLFFKKDGIYKVLRNIRDGSVVCSCQLFVQIGILCKHIFCVFKKANVERIPQQYILKRWTKNLIPATLRNKRNRYGEKNVIVDHYVHLLSKDEPRLGTFVEKLKLPKKDVEADYPNPPSKNKTDNLEQLVGVPKPAVVDGRNSCSLCDTADHNKRTCPGRYEVQEEVVVQKEVSQEEVVQEKLDLAQDEEELVDVEEDLIDE